MAETTVKVGSRTLKLSNLQKVLYPGGPFTKGQVIDYYRRISPVLLPHFKNRPVTLVRYPDGVFGESFFEKDAPGFTPEWVKTFPVPRSQGGDINYILINDLPTLIWVANLAALELHPFLHRVPQLEVPTQVVFDLDPGEGMDILACIEVAFLLKEAFGKLGLECFPKVSGSKGLQLYIPLNSTVSYEAVQGFARTVAQVFARERPDLVVADMSKALRKGKVFIDWSQNVEKKTTVGVYSLRAKRGVPLVSLPVKWTELKQAQKKADAESLMFSPQKALARMKRLGDLFEPVLKLKQKLPMTTEAEPAKPAKAGAPRSLAPYAAKRDFAKTREPAPAAPRRSAQGSRRRFVVQKHAASHLHYDFRLEMNDVLKSWAIPKGVPLLRGYKKSAFETEDHPLDYIDFEGIIPQGQYGGGTVMVWDIGTYEVMDGNYFKGELKIFMKGKKLVGEWFLKRLRTDDNGKSTWLIIKTGQDAKAISARKLDRSVVTGRTMEEIAEQKSATWQSNRIAA